jgi:iron(III) transport system substrate-binding protein
MLETVFASRNAAVLALTLATAAWQARADDKVLNLYSARHYRTDERLYADFTSRTGIRINRLEGKEDELLERIENEGANCPADVLLTVDAARLARAEARGLFAPARSAALEARIPPNMRTPTWFAFSVRARVIVYDKSSLAPGEVSAYEDLARPRFKGKVCVRSGSHPYNLSLGAALVSHLGAEQAEAWARGLVANLARPPRGGDTDQIRSVAAGECQVALANSYYVARLMRSDKPEDERVMARVGVVWPNQKSWGTHVNVSGGGVLRTAPHPEAAVRFLEYLASDEAQAHFAERNDEWPVVKTAVVKNPALEALGAFEPDALNVGTLAGNVAEAQRIFDRAGWR